MSEVYCTSLAQLEVTVVEVDVIARLALDTSGHCTGGRCGFRNSDSQNLPQNEASLS